MRAFPYYLIICLGLVAARPARAQTPGTPASTDMVVKRDGTEVAARIEEVTPELIIYRRADNLGGPLYSERRADVFMLKYANGTKDVFELPPAPVASASPTTVPVPADWGFPLAAAYPDRSGALSPMWVPDTLAADTLAARRFELGRQLAHAALLQSRNPSPFAPPLPQAFLPSDARRAARALFAYQEGYDRQLHRERATRADTASLVVVGLPFLVLLSILISSISSAP